MSKYSEISKRVGWYSSKRAGIPSLEDAKKLQNAVMVNHDDEAFEKVFFIHRYAPSPDGGEDGKAMEIIWETFKEGANFFK